MMMMMMMMMVVMDFNAILSTELARYVNREA